MRPLTALALSLTCSIGAGIALEKAGVPDKVAGMARELIDSQTRHAAQIMTDEAYKRRAELEAVKA